MAQRRIAVIFHSQQAGNTRAAAELVAEGIRNGGEFEIVMLNTNDARVDPLEIQQCAAAAFGSPDYFSYPAGGMKMFMDDWLIADRAGTEGISGMPVALFVTHGGGGRAKEPMEQLFERVGPRVGDTLMIKGKPEGDDAKACVALGEKLAGAAEAFLGEEQ